MLKVNNQLFQNFDHLVDLDSLLKLKPLMSAYIAKNQQFCLPTKFTRETLPPSDKFRTGIMDATINFHKNKDNYDPLIREMVQDLVNKDLFGSYIIFEDEIILASFSLNIRYIKDNFGKKHLASGVGKRDIDEDFLFFYQWLDKQNIFSEFGRVMFFVNYTGSNQQVHYDPIYEGKEKPDEFILINLFPQAKNFYLIDLNTNEKFYSSGYINWFDTENFHGADTVQTSCYTLRVDGVFSENFKSKFMAVPRGNDGR